MQQPLGSGSGEEVGMFPKGFFGRVLEVWKVFFGGIWEPSRSFFFCCLRFKKGKSWEI